MQHWIIQARPGSATPGPELVIDGSRVATLEVPEGNRGQSLAVTFDEVAARLVAEEGVYWEPDGSFTWTEPGPPRYRLQGQLTDGGCHLQHAEFWGVPSKHMLDRLIEFAGGAGALMFQLVQAGAFVDETTVRGLFNS